jgi:hypothetical protein
MRILLEAEATPSQRLHFPQGREKEGSSWHKFEVIVVHPIFEKNLSKLESRVASVEIDWVRLL